MTSTQPASGVSSDYFSIFNAIFKACTENCVCGYGYVLNSTATPATIDGVVCIPIQDCGCNDPSGNNHPADDPWLSDNCTLSSVCTNGTYSSRPNECSDVAECVTEGGKHNVFAIRSGKMQCKCDPGYDGDGYNCTDINECLDPNVCGAGSGQGVCTNLPGWLRRKQ